MNMDVLKMNRRKLILLEGSVVLGFILFAFPIFTISTTYVSTEKQFIMASSAPSVAYIYRDSFTRANEYSTFLIANGYVVSLINMTDILSVNLNIFDIIIIGDDTSYGYNWGTIEQVRAINVSSKPILGMSYGGSSFFEQLSLNIGWGNTWESTGDSLNITNADHQVFNTPTAIPKINPLKICNTTVDLRAVYVPVPTSNLTLLGQETDSATHYPLIMQFDKYALWGFNCTVSQMTTNGTALYLNLVNYLISASSKPSAPIPAFELYYLLIALLIPAILSKRTIKHLN